MQIEREAALAAPKLLDDRLGFPMTFLRARRLLIERALRLDAVTIGRDLLAV